MNTMNTINYPQRKTFAKFDDRHYLLYLGETAAEYTPDLAGHHEGEADGGADGKAPELASGYSYTGPMGDGGTLIAAPEATHSAFVSGLVRQRYSADDVEAILANEAEARRNPDDPRAADYVREFDAFQTYREECKAIAKEVIDREVS